MTNTDQIIYMESKNLSSKMNTMHINKFHYTPMITSQIQFEILVWGLMKGLARN